MIDLQETVDDVSNFDLKANNGLSDNYHINFIKLLRNSYPSCSDFAGEFKKLDLDKIYSVVRNFNVFVIDSPSIQLYHLKENNNLYSKMSFVIPVKMYIEELVSLFRKNTEHTFFLYSFDYNYLNKQFYFRLHEEKEDIKELFGINYLKHRRMIRERKLKLNQINDNL